MNHTPLLYTEKEGYPEFQIPVGHIGEKMPDGIRHLASIQS
jgi:hypothetical protein